MKPRLFLPAILTGPLLWAAFFPLNLGPLAFVALVPWLTLVRAPVTGKRLYFAGYLGGVAFFLSATQWFRVAHPMMYFSWLGLTLACPLFWLFGLFLLRRIDQLKLVPLSISVPVVWVALEYARAHFPTGFPFLQFFGLYQMIGFGWYFLGYTQHEFTALTQVADLGGVYVVSFLVAAVNGAVAERVLQSAPVRSWLRWSEPVPAGPRVRTWSMITGGLLVASIVCGIVKLDHKPFPTGPRVAAIQASVPQFEKNEKGEGLAKRYGELHVRASRLDPAPDLIVWPETCFPDDWLEIAPTDGTAPRDVVLKAEETAAEFARVRWGANVLLGLNGLEWEKGSIWKYNSALCLGSDGRPLGRYDKMHLVPFGEYVPLRETLPWMKTFTPYENDYSCRPGESWTRFPLSAGDGRQFTFGCLICYEDSDPYLARQYVKGRPVDFLVNISNDGWFNGTEEHEEHLAICRFRAIEARRSVVRAVNMGISAIIDPDGRVVVLPGDSWSGSKKVDGIVAANVPLDDRGSWYARFGDWLPAACWLLLSLGHLVSVYRKRTGPSAAASL